MSNRFYRASLLATTVIAGMAYASPAFAQDAPPAENTATDDQAPGVTTQEAAVQEAASEGEDIVVTGTLIRNPNLEQSTPVNVTTSDAIELKQSNVAEEVLRELPGVVSSIGSAVNNGNGGASFVDLRGLGSIRNIVLLDGNRLVPSGLAGRVDLNNIPLALIERVDALTGAAVTTYGADAITGVVNFITRKDFAGVEVAASEQITEKGDGNYFRADLTAGRQLRRRPRQRGGEPWLPGIGPGLSGRPRFLASSRSAPTPAAQPVRAPRSRRASRALAASSTADTAAFEQHRDVTNVAGNRRRSARSIWRRGGVRTAAAPAALRCGTLRAVQLQPVQRLPDAVQALQHLRPGQL